MLPFPFYIADHIVPAALELLPDTMNSRAAGALLLAIGLQESGFKYRVQQLAGPAHGFWQFEAGGATRGVLRHKATRPVLLRALARLAYPEQVADSPLELEMCHEAIINNDILACVFARLLLWTDPHVLPTRDQAPKAWGIYLNCWRPGTPRPATWDAHFATGWAIVEPRPATTARRLDPRV